MKTKYIVLTIIIFILFYVIQAAQINYYKNVNENNQVLDTLEEAGKQFKISIYNLILFSWNFDPNIYKEVSNLPEQIRFVKIHPDDQWKTSESNNGIIKNQPLHLVNDYSDISFSIGVKIDFMMFGLRVYDRINYHPNFLSILDPESAIRRDYLLIPGSDKRGEGTALTCYGILSENPTFSNNIILELMYLIRNVNSENRESKFYILCGIALNNNYELQVYNGWDRYNSIEVNAEYLIAKYKTNLYYMGLSFEQKPISLGICVGTSVLTNIEFIVDGVQLHKEFPYHISFQIGFNLF